MITRKQLIEAVRQVAATEPDFVYNSGGDASACEYMPNRLNACGCIVGEALKLLGVDSQRLLAMDQRGYVDDVRWGYPGARWAMADLVEPDALSCPWVGQVQYQQDRGLGWAAAVKRADERVGVPA